MECPKCKTEARIVESANIFREGTLLRKLVYACRNSKCSNYEKVIGEEELELPVTIE